MYRCTHYRWYIHVMYIIHVQINKHFITSFYFVLQLRSCTVVISILWFPICTVMYSVQEMYLFIFLYLIASDEIQMFASSSRSVGGYSLLQSLIFLLNFLLLLLVPFRYPGTKVLHVVLILVRCTITVLLKKSHYFIVAFFSRAWFGGISKIVFFIDVNVKLC